MSDIDPILLAVLNGRLVQIADEMDATLYRSAFNPIIAEAHDACHGLYHAETGATLVQGTSGLPIFVGAMAFAVRAVIEKAGRPAIDVIAEIVPEVVKAFPWPKSMRWGAASLGSESLRWVRPLSGIVALFDGKVVDCSVGDRPSRSWPAGLRLFDLG